ncbi:hypothetical protein [Streptomyces sp. NBC_00268]|uniref:hypothetical protein n=1 Tax=Streptomyces sp. NBC_00268 TaxID=2975695 RepID=UPI002253DF08|nr:hypothetical protein [Streptomyces sp. NBC_00268]MCX5190857.1 hypothetical protein [Streptomyces sp. NBC_00268]
MPPRQRRDGRIDAERGRPDELDALPTAPGEADSFPSPGAGSRRPTPFNLPLTLE